MQTNDNLNPAVQETKVAPTPVPETDEVKEKRHLAIWITKMVVGSLLTMFVSTVLTMLYTHVLRGDAVNHGVIGSFLATLTEVLKIMMS